MFNNIQGFRYKIVGSLAAISFIFSTGCSTREPYLIQNGGFEKGGKDWSYKGELSLIKRVSSTQLKNYEGEAQLGKYVLQIEKYLHTDGTKYDPPGFSQFHDFDFLPKAVRLSMDILVVGPFCKYPPMNFCVKEVGVVYGKGLNPMNSYVSVPASNKWFHIEWDASLSKFKSPKVEFVFTVANMKGDFYIDNVKVEPIR